MPFTAPGSPKSHPWLVSSFAHHLHSKFHYQPQFLGEMLPPPTIRPLHSMNAVIIAVIFAVHPSPQEGERYSYSLLLPNEWEFFLNPGRHLLREVLQLRYPKLPDHGSNLHSQNARNAKTMPKSKEKKKDHHHPTSKENVARAATASSTGTAIIVSSQSPLPPQPSHTTLTKPRPPNPAPKTTSLRTTSFLPSSLLPNLWQCHAMKWNVM